MKVEISDETYKRILEEKEKEDAKEISGYEDLIGKKFFFRGVTYHLLGKVKKKVGSFLMLEDASWIADSGRFMQTIKEGIVKEVEPVGEAFINLEAVVDFFPWIHELPTVQK